MAPYRFFLEGQVLGHGTLGPFALRLAPDDMRHAAVLRLEAGERLAVVDAVGDCFECEVVRFSPGTLEVRIVRCSTAPGASPVVALAQGIAKGDKMDQVVRQATELGVSAFLPFTSERSVVRLAPEKAAARTERWRAVAKSAAMQSGQGRIPEVAEPKTLKELAAFTAQATAVLVFWEEAHTGSIAAVLDKALAALRVEPADARVVAVVGPEGGLGEGEVSLLLRANPRAGLVSLGPSILRTETAGVVASALTLYELGGLR
ncbi:MAG: 16S rRNA (uracil(1498)-N(3))-methyltransferase [Eggerthellaceae bacterium]|nr:16S rRNA (uracil(1498)-N(3))-methyltransferase [Eggerthellaceae bacterium]